MTKLLGIAVAAGLLAAAAPNPVPRLFALGVVSTRDYERDAALTPDGRTVYFTKRTMWSYFSAICVSHLKNGAWSEPEVAPFSGRYRDATPFVTPDGAHLYFASLRPVDGAPRRDYDLWVVDRVPSGWSEPRHLDAPVNGPGNQLSPSLTRGGALYFVSDADGPHVMRSSPQGSGWLPPTMAGDSNQAGTAEVGAVVDPGERFLVVTVVGRADALHSAEGIYPRTDLYVRERQGDGWSALRHLAAPINSAADDGSPALSPDGKSLLFTSERGGLTEHGPSLTFGALEDLLHRPGNGLGDIYIVDLGALGLLP